MSNFLKGTNLYLIGMMGCGKTTVGQLLATRLGYRFFDTDTLVEQIAGQPIREIFATAGEAEFRQWEHQVLGELSAYTRLVIATGGGIVLRPDNWSYLHHGVIVWLDVPVSQLQERLQQDTTRPLLQTENLTERLTTLLEQRQALYAQADVRITVAADETPEQTVDRALMAIARACQKKADADEQIRRLNAEQPFQASQN